jgi:hypothetical protein
VLSVFLFVWPPTCKERYRPSRAIVCLGNLRQLGLCLRMYAAEHEGRYPPAQRWCDVLVAEYGEHEDLNKVFRCPGDPKGPCSYAMNPDADPNSEERLMPWPDPSRGSGGQSHFRARTFPNPC